MISPEALKLIFLWSGISLVSILISRLIDRFFERLRAARAYRKIVPQLIIVAMLLFGLTTSLGILGLREAFASTLTFSAILGLGAGFTVRELITNVIAGIELMMSKDFRVGDVVEIAGKRGKIVELGLSKTKLETSNQIIIIPNSRITSIHGWTLLERNRAEE